MRYLCIFFISCAIFASCNNSNAPGTANSSAPTPPPIPPSSKLSSTNTALLLSVVDNYYDLKNALVATKAANADSAAGKLSTASDSLKTELQDDKQRDAAMLRDLDSVTMVSKAIYASTDTTCETQRVKFSALAGPMYRVIKSAGLAHVKVYREFCPMANDEKGAFWLSSESEIKNPYLPKKMIECGEVTDSIQ